MAATTNLTFTKQENVWITSFTSTGECVIQIERTSQGLCSVLVNIAGMESVPIASFNNPYIASVIFNLDIPTGVEVTIKSATEVVSAKMLTE